MDLFPNSAARHVVFTAFPGACCLTDERRAASWVPEQTGHPDSWGPNGARAPLGGCAHFHLPDL